PRSIRSFLPATLEYPPVFPVNSPDRDYARSLYRLVRRPEVPVVLPEDEGTLCRLCREADSACISLSPLETRRVPGAPCRDPPVFGPSTQDNNGSAGPDTL